MSQQLKSQVSNANCTIIGSKEYPAAVKTALLEGTASDPRPAGKVRAFRTKLFTADGTPVVISGKLYQTEAGSINAKRVCFKLDMNLSDLCWVDSERQPKVEKSSIAARNLDAISALLDS
jgi:hypothetical protein